VAAPEATERLGLFWVIKRHGGRLVGTAEVPHIPDRIAAVPKTSAWCHFETWALAANVSTKAVPTRLPRQCDRAARASPRGSGAKLVGYVSLE
jgi:hypothetical protein